MSSSAKKRIAVFGATGTLGKAALDVAALHPDAFEVALLAANTQEEELQALAEKHDASKMVLSARDGENALCAAVNDADFIVMAISGMAALKPTLAAIRAGKTVAFASKEALVAAGSLMMEEARKHKATLLPLDSEHNAIFQCLQGTPSRIVLTASGGPFLNAPRAQLKNVTPQQAVAHPKWTMGAKISVDSATMMNKGLEIIEAHHLFALPSEKIDVLIHPQSLVHGMVEYADGSILCQMGPPDMRTAMTNVMFWPERAATPGPRLSLGDLSKLEFRAPDEAQFPALALARQALAAGQGACVALNAANEVAVAAFLAGHLPFLAITDQVQAALERFAGEKVNELADVFDLDEKTRAFTQDFIRQKAA